MDGMSNLLPEWRALLDEFPAEDRGASAEVVERGVRARDIAARASWWRSSEGQLAHGLRRMREKGLLESPRRGFFRLTAAGMEARDEQGSWA
jgi:hypothetical protein